MAPPPASRRRRRRQRTIAVVFALPALILLGALVVYPVVYSIVRSMFDAGGNRFVGVDNYRELFTDEATLKALRNTAVWVLVVPALLTGVGLVLAVLTQRMRWATAFKLVVFMPMAVSALAAGITFRLVYDQDPHQGVLNAVTVGVHNAFDGGSQYPGARPRDATTLAKQPGGGFGTVHTVRPGDSVALGLVGLPPASLPSKAVQAVTPAAVAKAGEISGTVYLDFAPGGAGRPNQVDPHERGLPGVTVKLRAPDGSTASTRSAAQTNSSTGRPRVVTPRLSGWSSGMAPRPLSVVTTGADSRSASSVSAGAAPEPTTPPPAHSTGLVALLRASATRATASASGA